MNRSSPACIPRGDIDTRAGAAGRGAARATGHRGGRAGSPTDRAAGGRAAGPRTTRQPRSPQCPADPAPIFHLFAGLAPPRSVFLKLDRLAGRLAASGRTSQQTTDSRRRRRRPAGGALAHTQSSAATGGWQRRAGRPGPLPQATRRPGGPEARRTVTCVRRSERPREERRERPLDMRHGEYSRPAGQRDPAPGRPKVMARPPIACYWIGESNNSGPASLELRSTVLFSSGCLLA